MLFSSSLKFQCLFLASFVQFQLPGGWGSEEPASCLFSLSCQYSMQNLQHKSHNKTFDHSLWRAPYRQIYLASQHTNKPQCCWKQILQQFPHILIYCLPWKECSEWKACYISKICGIFHTPRVTIRELTDAGMALQHSGSSGCIRINLEDTF